MCLFAEPAAKRWTLLWWRKLWADCCPLSLVCLADDGVSLQSRLSASIIYLQASSCFFYLLFHFFSPSSWCCDIIFSLKIIFSIGSNYYYFFWEISKVEMRQPPRKLLAALGRPRYSWITRTVQAALKLRFLRRTRKQVLLLITQICSRMKPVIRTKRLCRPIAAAAVMIKD